VSVILVSGLLNDGASNYLEGVMRKSSRRDERRIAKLIHSSCYQWSPCTLSSPSATLYHNPRAKALRNESLGRGVRREVGRGVYDNYKDLSRCIKVAYPLELRHQERERQAHALCLNIHEFHRWRDEQVRDSMNPLRLSKCYAPESSTSAPSCLIDIAAVNLI
jgi:hypothetical protein